MFKTIIKIILRFTAVAVIASTIALITCNAIVVSNANGKLYDEIDKIPACEVGLLLGTTPQTRAGEYSQFFKYRIDATEALFNAGKIKKILISGDENSLDGVNETTAMRDTLVSRGIPIEAISLDGNGFRTLDSVIRTRNLFGITSFTIISQRFHNERALFIAEHWGDISLNKVQAFSAKDPTNMLSLVTYVREYFARVKVFIDVICHKQPKTMDYKPEITPLNINKATTDTCNLAKRLQQNLPSDTIDFFGKRIQLSDSTYVGVKAVCKRNNNLKLYNNRYGVQVLAIKNVEFAINGGRMWNLLSSKQIDF